ncbi:conserved hypothetical protein [Methylobacterium sp. 4-46]|uniref:DUF2478 domain-containing protein n=1 Tax=unclassified Methylobacterium TaxID=2615210 RepID=UPI000152E22D|nr:MULTISPECIES: DUF2478 domain-containing protein [Methylobacterium]ACA19966.1 conserved hypothetical protein [Methylobacterium sp. 4-46]WFT79152.1 DUF2478 domain-containing protein [Methylobacterium nodulans]
MCASSICVVAYGRASRPDAVLAEVVRRLAGAGYRVGGLLQFRRGGTPSRCASLFLEEIGSGRRVEIFESRGGAARGCRLTTCGLAEGAAWLAAAVAAEPELLFVNRFGRQEAEGRGLRAETAAIVAGIPSVVPVSEALLPAWRAFAGEEDAVMPPDADRIEAWCRGRLLTRPSPSGRAGALDGMGGDAPAGHA